MDRNKFIEALQANTAPQDFEILGIESCREKYLDRIMSQIRSAVERQLKMEDLMRENELKRAFTFVSKHGESWRSHFVFKIGVKSIKQKLVNLGIEVDGRDICSPYDCTGRVFKRPVQFEARGKHIIASQFSGVDI